MRRVLSILSVLGMALLWAPDAEARKDEQGRPFAKGTVIPRIGFGLGWNDDLVSVSWTVGAGYFLVDGLELGGTVGGSHMIWSPDLKEELPGIEDKLPGTLMEITPMLRYVFWRNKYFSPYAFAGVGPTFLTNNEPAPVLGHWTAGPGFAIGIGSHVFLDLSVSFSGRFPTDTCEEAFTDVFEGSEGPTQFTLGGMCGFRWSPRFGIGFAF